MNVRSSLLVTSGSLLALLSGCVATTPKPLGHPSPEAERAYASHPNWSGRPVSWSKLADIEDWLRGTGPEEYPEQVPEAELQLAEGRLVLAQREAEGLPPPLLAVRLNAAESGFKALLSDGELKLAQKQRAERGLSQIQSLRAAGARPAPRAAAAAPAELAIQPRSSWGAAGAVPGRLTRVRGPWTRVTIHHSAKDSHQIGTFSPGNVSGTIHDIQTVHMRDSGWGDIGYHFLIDPTGRIWQGRSLEWQGAHAGGKDGVNNVGNIGICLLGDFDHERPDPRALTALEKLVDSLCEHHRIARSRIYGHRQLRSTECPGDALMAWVSRYSSGATD